MFKKNGETLDKANNADDADTILYAGEAITGVCKKPVLPSTTSTKLT